MKITQRSVDVNLLFPSYFLHVQSNFYFSFTFRNNRNFKVILRLLLWDHGLFGFQLIQLTLRSFLLLSDFCTLTLFRLDTMCSFLSLETRVSTKRRKRRIKFTRRQLKVIGYRLYVLIITSLGQIFLEAILIIPTFSCHV